MAARTWLTAPAALGMLNVGLTNHRQDEVFRFAPYPMCVLGRCAKPDTRRYKDQANAHSIPFGRASIQPRRQS
jgi:hypothetical protein